MNWLKKNRILLVSCVFILSLGTKAQEIICVGTVKDYFVDIAENNGEGTTGSTYQWFVDDVNSQESINPTTSSGNQVNIDWGATPVGLYTLRVTETNSLGCDSDEVLSVQIIDDTPPNNLTSPPSCTEVFVNTGLDDTYTYEWTVPTDANNPGDVPSFTTTISGTYSVVITSENGCRSASYSTEVEIFEKPVIQEIITEGVNVTIVATGGLEPLEYSVDGGNTWFESMNTFRLSSGQVFTAMVRNSEGCISDAQAMIDFVVQNTITPNGDGKNDVFEIGGLEPYPNAQLTIFDRYGKKLFDSAQEKSFRWDGTYLGRNVPTTSYWFLLDLGNEEEPFKGFIFVKNH